MSVKYPRDWSSWKWTHFHQRQEQSGWLIEVKSAKAFRSCGTYLWTYTHPHNRQYGWNLLNRLSLLLLLLLHVVGGRWLWISMRIHSRRMDNVILGVHNIHVISHESPFNSSHHRLSSVEVGQTQLGLAVARVTTFNASPTNFTAHHRLEEVEGNKKFPSD